MSCLINAYVNDIKPCTSRVLSSLKLCTCANEQKYEITGSLALMTKSTHMEARIFIGDGSRPFGGRPAIDNERQKAWKTFIDKLTKDRGYSILVSIDAKDFIKRQRDMRSKMEWTRNQKWQVLL